LYFNPFAQTPQVLPYGPASAGLRVCCAAGFSSRGRDADLDIRETAVLENCDHADNGQGLSRGLASINPDTARLITQAKLKSISIAHHCAWKIRQRGR